MKQISIRIFIFLLAFFPIHSNANSLLELDTVATVHSLGSYLKVLEDMNGVLSIDQIRSTEYDTLFKNISKSVPNFGHTHSAFWLKLNILNHSQPKTMPWILNIDFALLDYVDLYHYSDRGLLLKSVHTGMLRPFNSREYDYNSFVFNLLLDSPGIHTVYLRIQTDASMTLPLTLYTMPEFVAHSHLKLLSLGFYFGILLIMFVYHLFLFISLRDRSYFYFSLSISALILYLLSYSGLGFHYLWPDSVYWNTFVVPFFSSLLMLLFIKYTDTFLQLKKFCTTCHRLVIVLLIGHSALNAAIPLIGYYHSIQPVMILTLIEIILILFLVYFSWKKKNRAAGYFLLSTLGLAPGVIIFILVRFGVLASTSFTEISFKASTILFLLLMSSALAQRIKDSKREQDKSEQRFRSMVESSVDLIWEADKNFRFTYISPNIVHVLGYGTDELLNRQIYEFMNPDDAKTLGEKFRLLLKGNRAMSVCKYP